MSIRSLLCPPSPSGGGASRFASHAGAGGGRSTSGSIRLILAAVALAWSCGGKAVVDPGGHAEGGAGGESTTTTSTGQGGQGAATSCESMLQQLTDAIDAAQACDPTIFLVQCAGTATVTDSCTCELVANENYPELIEVAAAAYGAWMAAECGPIPCYGCPPPPSSPWYCDPTSWRCQPAYEN
jgi:hypothetical protein